MPGTAAPRDSRAGGGPSGSNPGSVGVRKDDARGPHRRRDHPLADDPVAHRSGRLVAASPDDRRPFGSPVALNPASLTTPRPRDSRNKAARARIDLELAQQLATPATVDDVQQQGAGGVAHLGGESAGQPVTDIILGQKDLATSIPVRGLDPADPKQLGGGEARRAGLATSFTSASRPPALSSISRHSTAVR